VIALLLALLLNTPCTTVDLPEDTEGTGYTGIVADQLIQAGWYGVAGDGAERLYSPGC
jgi:hypothetical protein